MHFLRNDVSGQTPKDFGYWRDLFLAALGAVAILGIFGHTVDWIKDHRTTDRDVALGFLLAYGLLALLSPKRYKYVFYSLVAVVAFGILGAISHATLIGFPVIVGSALLAYLLHQWKGDGLWK